ncbi:tetratricopeptide repeat protein [Ottowia thiooxydans]|uniref:tetratricopeptide repeat protein n=1 Tax=Ottowia thiooxydans TaxID=219182 RepID=UPI000426D03D|nr:tetratricopeptide repeat protein [Ottowia thiooxydans]
MRIRRSFATLAFVVSGILMPVFVAHATGSQAPTVVDGPSLDRILRAADQGNPQAQLAAGDAHMLGEGGIAQDRKQALVWYRKAALQGHTPAQRRLGYLYSNGEAVERDEAESLRWYLMAAELGDAQAQRVVGLIYGKEGNLHEAYFWTSLAVRKGNLEAVKAKDYIASKLSTLQKAEVQKRVAAWKPKPS